MVEKMVEKMVRNVVSRVVRILVMIILAATLFGLVVMSLWNWLMPALFGWRTIGFWQALGLVVLSKILFGGFRGGWGHGRHWRQSMKERWENMTNEQREQVRERLQGGCGRFRQPSAPKTEQP